MDKGKIFFDLISSRHSIRSFRTKKLPSQVIEKILTAASLAPSAGNLQSYHIFVVSKPQDKKKLAVAALDQNFIEEASSVFVFCAEPENSAQEYGIRGRELFSFQDATIACSYSQLAVHALGLSSVLVGSFDEAKVARDLNISDALKPVAMLVVGYADEVPEITTRRSLGRISHQL